MLKFAVVSTCIILALFAAPAQAAKCDRACKDRQVVAFFAKHKHLAKTQAGRIALLQVRVRRLGEQVRSLRSAKNLERRAEHDPEAARELGHQLALQRGWTEAEWGCVDSLFGPYESSWYVHADNPHSDAYGIPQALPGSKMGAGWQTSARVQILWGYGYVAKYGGPCGALSFRRNNGWY